MGNEINRCHHPQLSFNLYCSVMLALFALMLAGTLFVVVKTWLFAPHIVMRRMLRNCTAFLVIEFVTNTVFAMGIIIYGAGLVGSQAFWVVLAPPADIAVASRGILEAAAYFRLSRRPAGRVEFGVGFADIGPGWADMDLDIEDVMRPSTAYIVEACGAAEQSRS
eukprot:NODE_4459_length_672_cov_350.356564.p3 GENE.NODE_4459_length_672_cov_350.356564~~NODE_4459_length_672_cov_350.356564.p3  ORF type:complete len:165 (+),score=52.32 NODE_4459_length_672_cov_350.356564:3-497(+)